MRLKQYLTENTGKSEKGAINYLTKNFSSKIKYQSWDSVLGHAVNFIKDDITIQSSIRETKNELFLNSIAAKETGNLAKKAKGTGLGTKFLNILKRYSQKTKKKLIVPDATAGAMSFWNKIKWLKQDFDIHIDFDGSDYNPKNTFSYKP